MSGILYMNNIENEVTGAGSHGAESASSCRCPMDQQRGSGHHPTMLEPDGLKK